MNNIKVGLIGYGNSSKIFHAPLLSNVEGLQLAAICSGDSQKVHADYPNVAVVTTADELIADSSLDLIVIATPNNTHHALAKQALLAGKHVVVDKPFTVTLDEAQDLADHAKQANCLLSVFHNRRWDSDFLTVKALFNAGLLGDIVYFESHFDRFRPTVADRWREKAGEGTGIWYDLGPHLLDQALQLFGQPSSISADLLTLRKTGETVDYFHTILLYQDKRVILHSSMLVAEASPRYVIHGTQGSYYKYGLDPQEEQLKAQLSPLDDQFGQDKNDGILTQFIDQRLVNNNLTTKKGEYLSYYRQICDAIKGIAPNPVTVQEAMDVMRLIEAGIQSSAEKRVISL